MGTRVLLLLMISTPAVALTWEGDVGLGVASSNAYMTAPALSGRLGVTLAHASLSFRAIAIPGGDSFSGWMALSELRFHTGSWIEKGRLHLAFAAGVGREIAASGQPYADGTPGGLETGRTGPALLISGGGGIKAGALALSVDVAGFWWTRTEITRGAAPVNGGLGAMLLFCVGFLP